MGIFRFFRKNKVELTDEQKKWESMWNLWLEGRADSPYAELMTYESEINNGGHDQYFLNVGNTGDLQREMAALETVLPAKLQKNLRNAYNAYLMLNGQPDERAEAILNQCDDVFFNAEEEILSILKKYASA